MKPNKYDELKAKCQQLEHRVEVLEIKKAKLEIVLDKACEVLSNVEDDSCCYCPFELDYEKRDVCDVECHKKEGVKKYLFEIVQESEANK